MTMGQQASLAAMPSLSDPQATILQTAEAYRQAVLNGNAAAVTALFREDAVEMPPFQQAVAGRNAIAKFYEGAFHSPAKVTEFTFSHTETSVHGDVAIDVGTYKRGMTTPGGPMDATGPYVVILKQTEGKWRIAYLIYNCDCPPGGRDRAAQASR
jgi:uncharacterized protein (TIGR02246 family)